MPAHLRFLQKPLTYGSRAHRHDRLATLLRAPCIPFLCASLSSKATVARAAEPQPGACGKSTGDFAVNVLLHLPYLDLHTQQCCIAYRMKRNFPPLLSFFLALEKYGLTAICRTLFGGGG